MITSIHGIRTKCYGTKKETKVRIVLKTFWSPPACAGHKGEWWIRIIEGGVTGYESCRVEWVLKEELSGVWLACAGTDNRWDTLLITKHEMGHVRCWLKRKFVTKESERI